MIKLKDITPMYNDLVVTMAMYTEDTYDENGLVIATKGTLKEIQEVVATGTNCSLKPGDLVTIDYNHFKKPIPRDENSLRRELGDAGYTMVFKKITVYGLDKNDKECEIECMLINERDVMFKVNEYDEVMYQPKIFKKSKPGIVTEITPEVKEKVLKKK